MYSANAFGAIQILNHASGMEGLLIYVKKHNKGWVGCLWSVMLHVLNNLIFSTFYFILVSLAPFQNKFELTSKNNLAILF